MYCQVQEVRRGKEVPFLEKYKFRDCFRGRREVISFLRIIISSCLDYGKDFAHYNRR